MCTQLASTLTRLLTFAPTPSSGSNSTRLPNAIIFAGRPVVDGEAKPWTDVPAVAEAEAGGDSRRGVTRLSGGVQRAEDIGLQPRAEEAAAPVADRKVDPVLDAGLVERRLDIMDMKAAEQLARACSSGQRNSRDRGAGDPDRLQCVSPEPEMSQAEHIGQIKVPCLIWLRVN